MIVISGSLSLADTTATGGGIVTADNPVIGYQQLVTTTNITTTTAATGYPATNLANPSTILKWKGTFDSPEEDNEYITLALNTAEEVDYVGIAKHNFGTAQIAVSLEVYDAAGSPDWTEIVTDFIPADDAPILVRFTPQAVTSIRIRLQPGTEAPTAAVVYAGKLLVLQRRIYVGHTPITMGRKASIINGRSESGDFLGRVVTSETNSTAFDMQNLTPAWFRSYMIPFIRNAVENPFFFAWRPGSYPAEIGFAWLTNDPIPSNQQPNGMMGCSFEMEGVV